MVTKKSLKNLKPIYSRWKNSKTVAIRVPEILKEKILEYARKVDADFDYKESNNSNVQKEKIEKILSKIEAKEKGYKTNSAGQLIKDLRGLIEDE